MAQPVPINKLTEPDSFLLARESLEVSEFDVFCIAYAAWYGEQPALQQIENHFDDYLTSGILPFYVRHYCRQFIDDYPEFVIAAQSREQRSLFANRLVTGILVIFVTVALILA